MKLIIYKLLFDVCFLPTINIYVISSIIINSKIGTSPLVYIFLFQFFIIHSYKFVTLSIPLSLPMIIN